MLFFPFLRTNALYSTHAVQVIFLLLCVKRCLLLQKRMRYDAGFKLKVVELALQTSNINAVCHYSVDEKQVREWKKAECVLKEMPKKSKCNQKNPPKWPKLEDVAKWMSENRQSSLFVTRTQIFLFALNWAGRNEENSRYFKAFSSWCTRFIN